MLASLARTLESYACCSFPQVDCGGPCEACVDASMCYTNGDCMSNQCEPDTSSWHIRRCASCFNGIMDGREPAPDCGALCAAKCAVGQQCHRDTDCSTSTCGTNSRCLVHPAAPSTCANGVRDADETDTDCGGGCIRVGNPCSLTQMCQQSTDCASGVCSPFHRCVSCTDGIRNDAETAIDCGGTACQPCVDGRSCNAPADCASAHCACATPSTCLCSSCSNGIRDGLESDVDCGRDCPVRCSESKRCDTHADCASAHCLNTRCVRVDPQTTCTNGAQGEHESCPDGGGPQCTMLGRTCTDGATCHINRDCTSHHCSACTGPNCTAAASTAARQCVSCTDGIQNGLESDVDCGGPTCPVCTGVRCVNTSTLCMASTCRADSDCSTNLCFVPTGAQTGECYSHNNFVQDGDETWIDCGGPRRPSSCAIGARCTLSADCISGYCLLSASPATCQPQLPSVRCNNLVQDGTETDLDCGGSACVVVGKTCVNGQRCHSSADCETTSVCALAANATVGACEPMQCSDGQVNGDESDVDCGGSCNSCADGLLCATGADCAAGRSCVSIRGAFRCVVVPTLVLGVTGSGNVTISTGALVQRAVRIDNGSPTGGAGAKCTIRAKLQVFGGLSLSFPSGSSLGGSCGAVSSYVLSNDGQEVVLQGLYDCVAAAVAGFFLAASCGTPWVTSSSGVDTAQGRVVATVLSTDLLCNMPASPSVQVFATITNRPYTIMRGNIVRSVCHAQTSVACNIVGNVGVAGAAASGVDYRCQAYTNSLNPCDLGCCDPYPIPSPMTGTAAISCTRFMSYGFGCSFVAPFVINNVQVNAR